MPRIVCISDTHNCGTQIALPEGDILVHSGDATISGSLPEVEAFAEWFAAQPHRHKVFVAGNHDWAFQIRNESARSLLPGNIIYLQDSAAVIDGLKFYGSPWQPRFYDWAFNLSRGPDLAAKWAMVPDDTDVLITHGPPQGILDEVPRQFGNSSEGCGDLRRRVFELPQLRLHIFGHIHCGYGERVISGVRFVNASTCDESYAPSNLPIVVDL